MFDKIIDTLSKAGLIIGSILLAMMMLITVVDVFMRYVFSAPISGSAEMTQILLTLTVFAGFILVSRDGTHVVVSIFEPFIDRLSTRLYRLVYAISNTLGTAFLLWVLIVAVRDAFEYEDVTEGLEIPFGWIISVLIVFVAIALLAGFKVFTKGQIGHEPAD
ncbi:TRAP transporter small permease [Shimia abyssi]|uniref:TRAP transporter small permease protein n=1 Tax=Shimia abyssi TaxID=1662395 RepID=A0A2P8FDE3_9RHOB|nr:TRAP transporter small permease subunit [Shimia abyssi]PSL19731.1 TRAP-type C4-dicarboxylate transport system permease small subunit [Shimia abyssi]